MASPKDLLSVIDTFSKDQHGLCQSDIENIDRMHYKLVEKMIDSKVLTCLKKIPKSNATCAFIRLIKKCTDAFNRTDLLVTQRIRQLWCAVFFLRGWINWLRKSKSYSSKNFISQNAYECIELNAHSLLNLVVKCRDSNTSHLFLPHLFNSQPCECYFRHARSMTTTQSTVINFTMFDFLHKAKRIQCQEHLKCKLKDDFIFPRNKVIGDSNTSIHFPSDDVIGHLVSIAKEDAAKELNDLGITDLNFRTVLNDPEFVFTPEIEHGSDEFFSKDENEIEIMEAEQLLKNIGPSLDIRDFSASGIILVYLYLNI